MSDRLTNIGLAALTLFFAAVFFVFFAMDAVRDASRMGATFVPAENMRLVDGSCKTRVFVLNACELKLQDARTGAKMEKNYFFFGTYDARSIRIIRDSKDAAFVTTNLGQDRIWNRLLTTLPLVLLFVFGGVTLLFAKPASNTGAGRQGVEA